MEVFRSIYPTRAKGATVQAPNIAIVFDASKQPTIIANGCCVTKFDS